MSVASKAKKGKGPTFKNYLATPLPTQPTASLPPDHVAAIKASLELLRPLIHREAVDPASKPPHAKRPKKGDALESSANHLTKTAAATQPRATPDPAHIVRRGILCTGVNEVTRALEKSQVRLVIYSSDIQVCSIDVAVVLNTYQALTATGRCGPHCPPCCYTRRACMSSLGHRCVSCRASRHPQHTSDCIPVDAYLHRRHKALWVSRDIKCMLLIYASQWSTGS